MNELKSYSVLDVQEYFEYFTKKRETHNDKSPI